MDDEPRYRLDRPEVRGEQGGPEPPLSLCMIVKNEEDNLGACLASAAGLAGDIVVADTGSTDRTVEIARQYGARVFSCPWVDSFAAARNESLRHAIGKWVLWLDADDRLDAANHARLRALLAALPDANLGFVMKCLCLPDPVSRRSTTVDHVRLFRRHPALRWRYRVHEQILPSLRELGGDVRWSDVVIHHTGYQDPALRQRKLERDFRLLGLEHAENPGDAFVLFNLGMILHDWHRYDEALPYLRESLHRSHPTDSIVRKLYALISQCQRQRGLLEEALATCRDGRRHYPQDVELRFHESVLLKVLGDATGAEGGLLDLLYAQEGAHFASVNSALRNGTAQPGGVMPGAAAQRRGGIALARALAEYPEYRPCWIGLAELCLDQGRWAELESILTELGPATDSAILRGRALLAQREFTAARAVLEDVIAQEPAALLPRVVLSHVLLQEGRDLAAAERALVDVLALNPEHAEARRNLAILRRQMERGSPQRN